jgi:hypothetical protein
MINYVVFFFFFKMHICNDAPKTSDFLIIGTVSRDGGLDEAIDE